MSPSRQDPTFGPPRPYRSGPAVGRAGAVGRSGMPPRPPRPPRPNSRMGPSRPPGPPGLEPPPSLLDPQPDLELPPARPRGRYRGRRRQENPWASYGLIVAVPLVLVLLIVGFSALPPYTPNSRAQSQPNAPANTGGASATASQGQTTTTTNPPAGTTTVSVYEAEDNTHNTLGPTTKLRAVAGASGGEVVTSIGHGTPAGDVKFNAVAAAKAGRYTLTIYYLNGDVVAHRLALWVNGKGPTILSFPSMGGPTRIGTFRTVVTLATGTNSIRFSNATMAFGPDLDRITVQAQ